MRGMLYMLRFREQSPQGPFSAGPTPRHGARHRRRPIDHRPGVGQAGTREPPGRRDHIARVQARGVSFPSGDSLHWSASYSVECLRDVRHTSPRMELVQGVPRSDSTSARTSRVARAVLGNMHAVSGASPASALPWLAPFHRGLEVGLHGRDVCEIVSVY